MKISLKNLFSAKILLTIIISLAFLIRFWELDKVPSSLYWDEMDVGYQVYSFIKTGKDYFGNYLPIYFHSIHDFRTPLYLYLSIPSVLVFGLSELGVRFVSAFFGVLSVILVYLVVLEIFKKKVTALVGALLMSLSPWHVHYSRIAFEGSLLIFTVLVGVYGLIKSIKNPKYLYLAAFGFGFSTWVYSTAKLFTPLFVFLVIILFWKDLLKFERKYLIYSAIIFVILILPIFYGNFFLKGGSRFNNVSIFTDPTISKEVDQKRLNAALYSGTKKSIGLSSRFIDKLTYNKGLTYLEKMSSNYLEAFSFDFLFANGDFNLRHSPKNTGLLYRVEIIALIFGLIFVIRKREDLGKNGTLVILWLILAPVASSITREGGTHATRLILMLPPLIIVMGSGIYYIIQTLKQKYQLFIYLYFLVYFFAAFLFLYHYFLIYKVESASVFQYGFKEAAIFAENNKLKYDQVIIDDNSSVLMAYLTVTKFAPSQFQKNLLHLSQEVTKGIEADKIDNIYFLKPTPRDWWSILRSKLITKKSLLIVSEKAAREEDPVKLKDRIGHNGKLIDIIYYPSQKPAFYIVEFNN